MYLQILAIALFISVCCWSEAKAECTSTSPEFVSCTNTFKQDAASLQKGEVTKYCALLHVYYDCLKAKNCVIEQDRNAALDVIESRTGIKCGLVDGSVAYCMADQADKDRCANEYTVMFGSKVSAYTFWNNAETFCGSKNFAKQVGCVIDADRSCRDTELKTLLSDGDNYVSAVETLCDNIHELERSCLETIFTCLNTQRGIEEPMDSDSFMKWKKYTCELYAGYGACIEPNTTGVDTCNHPKTKELLKSVHKKIKPSACGTVYKKIKPIGGASGLLVTSVLFVLSIFVSILL